MGSRELPANPLESSAFLHGKRPDRRHISVISLFNREIDGDPFAADCFHRTDAGRAVQLMVVIDEFTRECLAIYVTRRIRAGDALEVCADLMERHGVPRYIRSDNGPEMIAKVLRRWLKRLGTETIYLPPGSPWENRYCASFNGKLRDELLNGEIFYTLKQAQVVIEPWRCHYTHHPAAQCAGIPSASS